ncbi:MAG: hypothetical protein V3V00_03280 [Saprospiraceae bacterium]
MLEVELFIDKTLQKYPHFGPRFFFSVIPLSEATIKEKEETLRDVGFTALVDTCALIYRDIDLLESKLEKAFRYYAYYTGDYYVPNVYTFVSGFAYQNFIFQDGIKDGLGIGLDMYMGTKFQYKAVDKKNPAFSEFLTQYFDKKYLVRKSLLSWLDDKIPAAQSGQLVEIMIRNGKIFFILEKLLPNTSKDIIVEYQPKEYQWCLINEPELWTHLLKNDLLYSSQFSKINKLINPSPGASGIPQEAPGGVANYIGWRIVQDYMMRSNSNIADLIELTDYQKILDKSKYRPRMRKR